MCEVVYPTSRAVELWEEDAGEERDMFFSPVSRPIVRLSKSVRANGESSTVACKLLVIAFGRVATTFIEAHFIHSDSQIVGVVVGGKKENDLNSVPQTDPFDKTCFIHSSSPDVLFCQSKVEYPAGYCHDWAKEVLSSIKADSVLVLSTMPSSLCMMNDEDEPCCVFSLKTNTWKSTVKFPFLKSPNIISDLPAAVLTHCQIFGTPAVMYVGVEETDNIVDSRMVSMFHPLLEDEPLKYIPKRSELERSDFMKSLKMVSSHLDSNLYI